MSRTQFKNLLPVMIAISSTLLAIPSSGEVTYSLNEVFAQNQTVANQTVGTAGQNQTVANTTRLEFELLQNSLTGARTGLHENNTSVAFKFLTNAEDEIYDLTHVTGSEEKGEPAHNKAKALEEQLRPVRESVNQALEAIWNNEDNTSPLNAISSAEVSLLRITQTLPPGEVEAEE